MGDSFNGPVVSISWVNDAAFIAVYVCVCARVHRMQAFSRCAFLSLSTLPLNLIEQRNGGEPREDVTFH